jgi:ATP-dependent helicase/nuclease subunit B
MPQSTPRVFNIPASARFLPVLVDALRGGRLVRGFPASPDPLELSRATLYLPTRRACRLARDVFLKTPDGNAAILPRIVALGDLDEDEIIFAEAATGALAEDALKVEPAVDRLERRLLLAQLIADWADRVRSEKGAPLIANTPAARLALADDLGRLIDDVITRKMDWALLDDLVPDQFDEYWQFTLKFLKIARSYWPERLNEIGEIDAANRRDQLIDAEMKRLASSNAPVIAAGSTGSMPATASLLAAIARLPHGAVVLPGAVSIRKTRQAPCIPNSPCMPCLIASALSAMQSNDSPIRPRTGAKCWSQKHCGRRRQPIAGNTASGPPVSPSLSKKRWPA